MSDKNSDRLSPGLSSYSDLIVVSTSMVDPVGFSFLSFTRTSTET